MTTPHLHFMKAQDYITNIVVDLKEPVAKEDLNGTSVEDAIYAKLMSKKFRKLKVDAQTEKIAKEAIKRAVAAKKPVTVSILFGGNKLWRFEEAPEIDWAELFSLVYFVQWLKRINAVYEHGVRLDYYSQDVSVESLNNVPRSETDKYSQTFRDMLNWIKPHLPENVEVTYRRHLEEYDDPADYQKELEEGKKKVLEANDGKLPELTKEMKAATELNVKLKPGQDDDPEWREKVELEHQAIFQTKTLLPYLNSKDLIPACPTHYPGLIVTGSTKRSYAKFWAAIGALQEHGNSYREIVLTPQQLNDSKFVWEDISIDGLTSDNFKKIRIVKD